LQHFAQADLQAGAPVRQITKFGAAADMAMLYHRYYLLLCTSSNVFSGKPVALFYKSDENDHEK